jgi:hypothetical protein
LIPTLVLAGALAAAPSLSRSERSFAEFLDADDRARAEPTTRHVARRDTRAAVARDELARVDPDALPPGDLRALQVMRRALEPRASTSDALTGSIYKAYGEAAQSIAWRGETLDRLTILGRLAAEPDRERRKSLFLALTPVWTSMAGTSPKASPYAKLVAANVQTWSRAPERSPFTQKAREWGLTPQELEGWLVRVLEAWREAAAPESPVEPWDWYYATGAADRAFADTLSLPVMLAAAERYYDGLGASRKALHLNLDLAPRPGKDPVAFTDFVRHGHFEGGRWQSAKLRISASYRTGGLGNLYELMHEMGHAAHIAAIRGRPAFADWPDSDVLTEALADVLGVTAYEPAWQRRYLDAAGEPNTLLRSRLSGTMLDVAWALLEMRAHRDPTADPSAIWAELTSHYLGIVPHPELPWWAMRGQLIDAPGYMTNYALGAILTEALRDRVKELRGDGAFVSPTPELYAWLSERLYRFGLARPSSEVVEDFLGCKVSPDPLVRRITEIALAFPAGSR